MLKKMINECTVQLRLDTVDPILIKSGLATLSGPNMAFVVTYRGGRPEPYLPGSSLKGVLRSHAERIARTLKSPSACEPFWNDDIEAEIRRKADRAATLWCGKKFDVRKMNWQEPIDSATAYKDSCPACRFFGSTYFVGRFAISDAYLIQGKHGVKQQRDGVGIDRFTGGASKRAKFDLEVLTGASFECTIHIRNFEVWQLGWMAYLIQDLKDAIISVGSGTTRGLGRVRGEITNVQIGYVVAKPEDLQASNGGWRLRGIGSLAMDPAYGLDKDDEVTLPQGFSFARPPGKLRHECRLGSGDDARLWQACADKWDAYINRYTVPERMAHGQYLASLGNRHGG
jgi:CRISPR-associated RAMP protein (TIGR02581 family)